MQASDSRSSSSFFTPERGPDAAGSCRRRKRSAAIPQLATSGLRAAFIEQLKQRARAEDIQILCPWMQIIAEFSTVGNVQHRIRDPVSANGWHEMRSPPWLV